MIVLDVPITDVEDAKRAITPDRVVLESITGIPSVML